MDEHKSFSNSTYEEQTYLAEREPTSFIAATTQLYGSEPATLSERTARGIGADGQSVVVYEPTVASRYSRGLSSTGRPIEHPSASYEGAGSRQADTKV
jgi:hypothetical protein